MHVPPHGFHRGIGKRRQEMPNRSPPSMIPRGEPHNIGVSMYRHSVRSWAIVGLLIIAACATKTAPPPKDDSVGPAFAKEYRIGIGDNLKIDVYRNPDLSVSVTVRPD